jgi:hypothetical protein
MLHARKDRATRLPGAQQSEFGGLILLRLFVSWSFPWVRFEQPSSDIQRYRPSPREG